jgi:hypothetical protein
MESREESLKLLSRYDCKKRNTKKKTMEKKDPCLVSLWHLRSGPFLEILKTTMRPEEKAAMFFVCRRTKEEYPWQPLLNDDILGKYYVPLEQVLFLLQQSDRLWMTSVETWTLFAQRRKHDACDVAAREGRVDCLAWLRAAGCPWSESTCMAAACGNREHCLRYLRENDCPWDENTCWGAARRGNLACLAYAHENGCPWDVYTCLAAAIGDHVDCLAYAYENGCPLNYNAYHAATFLMGSACSAYIARALGLNLSITTNSALSSMRHDLHSS